MSEVIIRGTITVVVDTDKNWDDIEDKIRTQVLETVKIQALENAKLKD